MLPSIRILSAFPQGQMLQSITIQNTSPQGQMFFGRNSPISNSGSLFSSVNTTFGQTPIVFERRCFFGLFYCHSLFLRFLPQLLSQLFLFPAFPSFFSFLPSTISSYSCPFSVYIVLPPPNTKMTKITTLARYEYSQSSHNRGRHSG